MPSPESTACQRECATQQKDLTSCVESIRSAREEGATSIGNPQCLADAVAAWTRCCEDANLKEAGRVDS